jgi:hypothetical protein
MEHISPFFQALSVLMIPPGRKGGSAGGEGKEECHFMHMIHLPTCRSHRGRINTVRNSRLYGISQLIRWQNFNNSQILLVLKIYVNGIARVIDL